MGLDILMSNSGQGVCSRIWRDMPLAFARAFWETTQYRIHWRTSIHNLQTHWWKWFHCHKVIGQQVSIYTHVHPSTKLGNSSKESYKFWHGTLGESHTQAHTSPMIWLMISNRIIQVNISLSGFYQTEWARNRTDFPQEFRIWTGWLLASHVHVWAIYSQSETQRNHIF